MRLILALLLLAGSASTAIARPTCDDSKLIYKTCSDQNALLKSAIDAAKRDKKLLVVTFGADWCGFCQSLHGVMGELQRNPTVQTDFSFASIGLQHGEEELPSGEAALRSVLKQAGIRKMPTGIPYLCVVSPSNKKASCMDTSPLESEAIAGRKHDPQKVLAALNKARASLK